MSKRQQGILPFSVAIITKVNMIKSQELVNFHCARTNGLLRVTFIYRKQQANEKEREVNL